MDTFWLFLVQEFQKFRESFLKGMHIQKKRLWAINTIGFSSNSKYKVV